MMTRMSLIEKNPHLSTITTLSVVSALAGGGLLLVGLLRAAQAADSPLGEPGTGTTQISLGVTLLAVGAVVYVLGAAVRAVLWHLEQAAGSHAGADHQREHRGQ